MFHSNSDRVSSGLTNRPKLLSGSNPHLANRISETLGVPLIPRKITRFKNGEICVSIQESVRNHDVFVIQSKSPTQNLNDMLMELLIIIDACRRSAARSIYVVLPCYPYARQDKKEESREPITAKLVANLLAAAGMTRLLVMDLHAAQIQGFFDLPVDNMYSVKLVEEYLKQKPVSECGLFFNQSQSERKEKYVLVSPDAGATKRTLKFGKVFSLPTIIMHKQRDYSQPNTVQKISIIGDTSLYSNKTAIILDDMIDTAGTLVAAVEALVSQGFSDVVCIATHGILSALALERINKCHSLTGVLVSDSIDQTDHLAQCSKLHVFSIAPLLSQAIYSIFTNASLSFLF